jgi:catechol 2,3-dioxygenase-like lactoylglutathione lyase family enzyme
MAVPARVSLVTLGVADVERATAFYQALGWRRSPASVAGEVSFFHTDGGLLAVWDLAALAAETGQTPDQAPGPGFRHSMLALNLDTPAEVDAVFEQVVGAGGRAVKAPSGTDWGGYSACFADPDGHLWEVAYNPDFPLGPDGRPTLPRSPAPE